MNVFTLPEGKGVMPELRGEVVVKVTMETGFAKLEQDGREGFARPAAFAALCTVLYAAALQLPDQLCEPANRWTARLVELLLASCGVPVHLEGTTLGLGGFHVQVVTECCGLYLALLYCAFLICWPSDLRAKLVGMLGGLPFLYAANLARIAAVAVLGSLRPAWFPYLHVYLAQVAMVLLVCLASLCWLSWNAGTPSAAPRFLFPLRLASAASLLFLCWLPIHHSYLRLLDRLVIWLFSLVDFVLFIPSAPVIYHHTFSLVVFASLTCASAGASPRRLAVALAAGIPLLSLGHLLFRITQVLLTAWHLAAVLPVHLCLHLVNQYLFPVFLWLWLVHGAQAVPGRTR